MAEANIQLKLDLNVAHLYMSFCGCFVDNISQFRRSKKSETKFWVELFAPTFYDTRTARWASIYAAIYSSFIYPEPTKT